MKKVIILGIILISLLFLGGCAYVDQICSQFLPEVFCGVITCVFGESGLQNILNNQEVRNFLETHPFIWLSNIFPIFSLLPLLILRPQ